MLVANNSAVTNAHYPFGAPSNIVVMRNNHHCAPLCVQFTQQGENFKCGVRIKRTGRFIGQQQARVTDQGAGNCHPLLLSARQLIQGGGQFGRPAPPRSKHPLHVLAVS